MNVVIIMIFVLENIGNIEGKVAEGLSKLKEVASNKVMWLEFRHVALKWS